MLLSPRSKFVKAHSELIKKKINGLTDFKLIFFSSWFARKNIKKGDPYQWQVEQSVSKILEEINPG